VSNPRQGRPSEKNEPSDLKAPSVPLAPMFFLGAFGGSSLYLLFMTGSYNPPNEINGAYLWESVAVLLALFWG
jgi:hypothetical protein